MIALALFLLGIGSFANVVSVIMELRKREPFWSWVMKLSPIVWGAGALLLALSLGG